MNRRGLVRRLSALFRGALRVGIRGLEVRHPASVYDAAIQERTEQHDRLLEAASRLTYLRRRVEATLDSRRKDLDVVDKALAEAAKRPEDEPALTLLRRQRLLREEIAPLEERSRTLAEQTDRAKQNLATIAQSVQQLREERSEMLARRTHAETRLEMAEVVRHSAEGPAAADEALENVRESIEVLEHMADLDPSPPVAEGPATLGALRHEAERRADLEALAALRARHE